LNLNTKRTQISEITQVSRKILSLAEGMKQSLTIQFHANRPTLRCHQHRLKRKSELN
jgi:hypothetical protein